MTRIWYAALGGALSALFGAGLAEAQSCYGIDPYLVELDETRREVHGNDERFSLENLGFGLRLHLGILEEMEK